MPATAESILDYLRSDNPMVSCVNYPEDDKPQIKKANMSNTTNVGYLQPKYIWEWEEFDYNSLEAIYDGQLRDALARKPSNVLTDHSAIPHLPFCEIHDENSLEALLVRWNQSVVSDALKKTQDLLGAGHSHSKIYMVRGGQANRLPGIVPDWAGVQRSDSRPCRPSSILPGDTKVSWKWSSQKIQTGETEDTYLEDDWLEPIKQIYTYCCRLEARYGYIITEKELVVVRIRPVSQSDIWSPVNTQDSLLSSSSPRNGVVAASLMPSYSSARNASATLERGGTLEFKAIPWSSAATNADTCENSLTINLALWWLHMMALESHQIDYWYPPLAAARRSQTCEVQDPGLKANRPTSAELRHAHSGVKRSRDEISEEDDGLPVCPSPKRTPMRSTRSKAKNQLKGKEQTDPPSFLSISL